MYFLSFLDGLALFYKIVGNGQLCLTTLLFRMESKGDLLFFNMQWFLGASREMCIFVPLVT